MKASLTGIPKIAELISKNITGGQIFGLIGPLGSGKTTFVKSLAKKLKVKSHVTSPTFVLMNRYKFKKLNKNLWLYHLDIYRLKNFKDVEALGIKEIWHNKDNVVVIEWADKIKKYLPKKTKKIYFSGDHV